MKTKIKSYKGKVNTNFDIYKIPKQGSLCNCLSVILINSVFRIGKNYYQVFLEKCKFVVKEIKMPDYITKFRPMILVKWMVKKILMKKILMNKIRHRMSQMIRPYILWKKVLIFNAIQVILTKYVTHITHINITEKQRKASKKDTLKISKLYWRRKNVSVLLWV